MKHLSADTHNKKVKKHRLGITWKMYAILIPFIGIVVGVIWFFEIQMMNSFFQITKFKELEITSQAVASELIQNENLNDVAQKYAAEYHTDIWIYHVSEQKNATPILTVDGPDSEPVNFLTTKISKLYDKAKESEQLYIALVPQEQFSSDFELIILRDNLQNPSNYPILVNPATNVSAIGVSICHVNQSEYLIVQRTNLMPISSMVKTLQSQSLRIAVILSLLALLMAAFMSRLITKPIVKMNEAAKQLALGRYDANFSGDGYREIDELADTLNYASSELAKTNHLQKELISNISHDLRTPLTMIKGYGEVMRDIPGENTPENIQIIIDETSRLSELVNDMLDLSRIQAGTRAPQFMRFSLTETVRATMSRYERLMMQEGYRIEFLAQEDAEVIADRGMILQVIYNLINNAINYTGEDRWVSVRQEVTRRHVRVRVLDSGEGIPEDQLSKIWERYYKVDKVHKRATVGTGLGLSIVREILELHHAAYGVESTLGNGSEFWFELPLAPSDVDDRDGYIEANYDTGETN
jgi:signal transduction histidine kinase